MFRIIDPDVEALKASASNIVSGVSGAYTEAMFYEDFPQFKDSNSATTKGFVPSALMTLYIKMCNDAVAPARWGEVWRLAAGLFVAHYVTLYLRANKGNANGSATATKAADTGAMIGIPTGASLGDASVSYDTSSITNATENWGQWNLTSYGQQFASMARLVSVGGGYVI